MYERILVPLEVTPTDRAIVDHIKELARALGSSVCLLHVATGVPAQFSGASAAGEEIENDTQYLERIRAEFEQEGIPVHAELAFGDPRREILRWVEEKGCSLIAMSTHGHRFVADFLFGTTASHVQHRVDVPVLLIRAKHPPKPGA